MKWVLAMSVLVMVAACGADGEPVTPTRSATVTLSDAGVAASGQVGLRRGPLAVTLGLGL